MTTPFPFVSGAVLTAAQLNAITEVPVSAKTASYTLAATDAGSRITMSSASATTITVNTGLFSAGQSLRIQNLNGGGTCTVTAGTATVTSAGPLALVAWAGGQLYFTSASAAVWFPDAVTATASGLTFISKTTITSTAATTISNIFTSTYNDYRVIVTIGGVTDSNKLRLQLTTSGTPVTSGYSAGCFIGDYTSGAPPLINYGYAESANFVLGYVPNSSTQNANIAFDMYGPQATQKTAINGQTTSVWSGAANAGGAVLGFLDSTTSYDGIKIYSSANTALTGTVVVYGYAKA